MASRESERFIVLGGRESRPQGAESALGEGTAKPSQSGYFHIPNDLIDTDPQLWIRRGLIDQGEIKKPVNKICPDADVCLVCCTAKNINSTRPGFLL